MAPKLYMTEASPPVRSTLITAAAIGLELEKHNLDLMKQEHKSPEFLKINPLHTVPTLVDGDYVIWDSHAINPYLVEKYGKKDSLYPKDLQKRGTVDQRLHYNNATIFNIIRKISQAIFFRGETVSEELINETHETYDLLNKFLTKSKFVAGDDVTVADFSIFATVTTLNLLITVDEIKYPKLAAWIKAVKELPCSAENEAGLRKLEIALSQFKK